MATYRIPFNRPTLVGTELDYVGQSVGSGKLSGDGPFTTKCRELLERSLGAGRVLLTTSCTRAIEMAGLLLELEPGDEVIVPSFTFVSTVNALVLFGAHPVFADIRPDTLNLDEDRIEALITPRTRVIVPVHYAGVGAEMDCLMDVAARRGVMLIEDNAHGLFGTFRGRALGTFAPLAALSFHDTKNLTCGEGGALIVNDPSYVERAEILREKGTNRTRFVRGEIDSYSWVDVGSSYLPADLLAAFLYAQLESGDIIQARRRCVWERYRDGLSDLGGVAGVRLPVVPPHCEQSYHMFYVLLPSDAVRRAVIEDLAACGIQAVAHYPPLHLSEMGARFGAKPGDCPVSQDASRRLLRLPFYTDLTEADQDETIAAFRQSAERRCGRAGG